MSICIHTYCYCNIKALQQNKHYKRLSNWPLLSPIPHKQNKWSSIVSSSRYASGKFLHNRNPPTTQQSNKNIRLAQGWDCQLKWHWYYTALGVHTQEWTKVCKPFRIKHTEGNLNIFSSKHQPKADKHILKGVMRKYL